MLGNGITHRLFVVVLGQNDHGKTTIIRGLVQQGQRREFDKVKRATRSLQSPWGRSVDALVIPRSYQETLRGEFGSIESSLENVDSGWRERDLVVFPSHLDPTDCRTMIELGHNAGFDVICVAIRFLDDDLLNASDCLGLPWDRRWTLNNQYSEQSTGQLLALGNDLWSWVAAALANG